MNKERMIETHMQTAELYAGMSRGIRAKVGCVIVTESGVLLPGYNGTPKGFDNALETVDTDTGEFVTKPTVIHAELNCVMKAAREGISVRNARVFVTHSCCVPCAAMLVQAGVDQVYYRQVYKNDDGIKVLREGGIFTKLVEKQ